MGCVSGLIALAARSDFTFRGCQNIPRSTWDSTANCSDGWFAQAVFGALSIGLILGSVGLWVWRTKG